MGKRIPIKFHFLNPDSLIPFKVKAMPKGRAD